MMTKPSNGLILYLLLFYTNEMIEENELQHHTLTKSLRTLKKFVNESSGLLENDKDGVTINKLAPHNFSKIMDGITMDLLMTPEGQLTIEK